jgi:hypothetical protein
MADAVIPRRSPASSTTLHPQRSQRAAREQPFFDRKCGADDARACAALPVYLSSMARPPPGALRRSCPRDKKLIHG